MSTLYLQSDSTAARRKFTFVCVDDSDGKTPETGLTFSSSEVALRKAGTTSYTAVTNIASIVEIGDGEYEGEFTTTEINTDGPLVLRIKKTGVRTTVIAIGQVVAVAIGDIADGAITAAKFAAGAITSTTLATGAIGTAEIQTAVFTQIKSGLATSADLATVDSNVDAIKAKTDNLPAAPASTEDVTSAVADLATAAAVAAIPTTPLLADDPRLDNLDAPISGLDTASLATALAAVPAAVWQRVLDSNAPANAQTAERILNLIAAEAYGPKTEAADGSVAIRDPGNTKDRITGTATNGTRTLTGADGS